MLAAGIALGALIGPGPATSLASGTRAAAIARVLALLALEDGASAGNGPLLASGAAHPHGEASRSTATHASGAGNASGAGVAGAGASATGSETVPSGSSNSSTAPASGAPSRTPKATQPSTGGGETEAKPKPLPPVAQVWLIVLPYGQSFTNSLGQPTAAPYLAGQLLGQGTLLSAYSSLAGSQLAGAATLLSGQEAASVSVLSPPACASTTGTQGAAGTAGTQVTSGTVPCPSGEPAGLQGADAFVREAVAQITASAEYREHGLIAITFAEGSGSGATTLPAAGSPTASTPASGSPAGVAYPAGTLANTLTAAGAPAGVLLLSPFLRHPGKRLTSAFNALAPRKSLEEVLAMTH
jgi:hypothetical protein